MTPEDRDLFAAELALGVLGAEERAAALRLCLSDPAFGAAVEAWSLRLSPLLDTVPPADAPARTWNAVAARIGLPANNAAARHLRLWRGSALFLATIAAGLALFIVVRPPTPVSPASGISQLANTQGVATLAVAYDPQQGVLRISPASLSTGQKSPELWVIPADGKPRSLGLLNDEERTLRIAPDLRSLLQDGVTLAITLEDPASAPHDAPTSTPILTGKITLL
ncbi:anti-sigma factor [Sphingobium sp.]|uniref:anti-sigma factor n=1 Tax=Sphingobium sp. TaxID=1912891 RepID=UPI002BC8012F|nr:anti-sigma factor [Sphingobium sp.]HUD94856.1 anti-sigma factor [Sphingobium sp.]